MSAGVYVVAAVAALGIRLPHAGNTGNAFAGVTAHMREGASMIRRSRDLAFLVTVAVLWRLCFGCQSGLLMVYVAKALGKGSLEFGVITAAIAGGCIAGGLAGSVIAKRFSPRPVMLAGMTTYFLLAGCLGLITSYPLALVDAVAANAALYVAAVAVHSARDRLIPSACRGRVLGSNTLISAVPALVSMLAGGWLADAVRRARRLHLRRIAGGGRGGGHIHAIPIGARARCNMIGCLRAPMTHGAVLPTI